MSKLTRLIMIATLLLALPASPLLAQSPPPELETALSKLDEGTTLLEYRDARSEAVLSEAAALLNAVIEEHGLRTPGVYHALGNAYMLAGDTGRAVLAYRRGEQIDPTNIKLRESLAHARSQIPVRVEPETTGRLWRWSMLWRGRVPRIALWTTFAALFTLGWIACAARVLGLAPRAAATGGGWAIALSLIPFGLLAAEWSAHQGSDDAVITQPGVIARTGPDDQIYDPVFEQALTPGVEGRIVESRDGWDRLALSDGAECWVPSTSLEAVNPAHIN